MELILRGSEYQDFLQCRKKWYHGWVEKITPKRPDGKLFFGTVFHKWLEFYYNNGCNKLQADLDTSVWWNNQDTSAMTNEDIEDTKNLFMHVAEYYDETYRENDSVWNILGTEVEFIVKLQDGMYFTGTIDLVYEVNGKVRFADHKTVSSLSMYEEKSKMDRQISRYWWALKMIAAGIGMIKTPIVKGDKIVNEWKPWDALLTREIDGFDYNLIAKDYPRQPKVLKSGKLSTDKAQKTTYKKYVDKIYELGLTVDDYTDILDMLLSKPDPFLKRVDVKRTDKELESAIWEMLYTAGDIHDVKMLITEQPQLVDEVTYRHIGTHCEHMCQFKSLCQTTIEGGNVSLVRNLGYTENKERV